MKNSNNQTTEKLKKCPYPVFVYGENNCDITYSTSYKGDWGHWDEACENDPKNSSDSNTSVIKKNIKCEQNQKK
jgi:hypothetical protein